MMLRSMALLLSAVSLFPSSASAADVPVDVVAVADAAAPTEGTDSEEAVPLEEKQLKTMFKNLRFEEDWSGLKDPGTTTDHWFPGMKYVELEEGWYATFGGQVRYQWKSEQNKNLAGGPVPHNNDYNLIRTRLHGDLHIEDAARIFLELIYASIHANDAPPTPIDEDRLDVLNLFLDLLGEDVTLRVGRFEMQYGAQRLISPLDWGNTRRTFQGAMVKLKYGDWLTDVFLTKPVIVDPTHANDTNASRYFSGVYNTWKINPQRGLDVYGLALNETEDVFTSGAGNPGDMDLYTVGGRYWAKQGAWDYEAEAARQFGDRASDVIEAYMWTVRGGYTFEEPKCKPRIGVDVDYASGDRNAADGKVQTFNQLFPLGHAYFGYLDLVGRQNIIQVMPYVTAKVSDTSTFRASYSDFELANDSDALYNASGAVLLSDPTGNSGTAVGRELDLTLAWAPSSMAPHGEFLFGYSIFWPDRFVDELGDGEKAKLAYLQYSFTF